MLFYFEFYTTVQYKGTVEKGKNVSLSPGAPIKQARESSNLPQKSSLSTRQLGKAAERRRSRQRLGEGVGRHDEGEA